MYCDFSGNRFAWEIIFVEKPCESWISQNSTTLQKQKFGAIGQLDQEFVGSFPDFSMRTTMA